MLQEVTKFKTPDGREFVSKEEALAHLNAEKYLERVAPFMASREWKKGRGTLAINTLKAFLAFEDQRTAAA